MGEGTPDLYDLLKSLYPSNPPEIDRTTLKYAIYARKSTTQDERQEKSLSQQIKECIEKVVAVDNLTVVQAPIEEKCSAKEPDIRLKFTQLMNDVRSGKIDGIIAWHPDRLSRNMKEAGEIIDLLDKGVLKDLRFATSSFENSPTDKMLLGISFVLSKQYSEHLSESVTRGNRRKTEEGYFFDEQKHGYFIQGDRLHPDPVTFVIIRQAFNMRLENASQPQIVEWLNSTGYCLRRKNKDPVPYVWDKDAVSKMLRDPLYAGVLKYGKAVSKLDLHYDFTPMITEKVFFQINKITTFKSPKIQAAIAGRSGAPKANFLRQIVYCGYCYKPFSSGLTPKILKAGKVHYYFYKCETNGCSFKGKSVRAKHVMDYAINFLNQHQFTTKTNYDYFLETGKMHARERAKVLNAEVAGLTATTSQAIAQYESVKALIATNPNLQDHYDLKELKTKIEKLTSRRDKLIEQRSNLNGSVITYEKYLELFRDIGDKLQKTEEISVLDQILRNFFSNFTILTKGKGKQQIREISCKLKEPWDGFLKYENYDSGRG